MSTTPQPAVTLASLEPQWVKTWVTFVKGHEKFLVIVLGAALAFHFYSKAITAWDQHEQRLDNVAQQQVIATQQKVDSDAAVNKQLADQLAQLKDQFARSEASLRAQIAAETAALRNRTAQDNALPMPQLAQRWSTLLNLQPGNVWATIDTPPGTVLTNDITLTPDAAHATVAELEKVPVLTQQLEQTNTNLTGCKVVAAKQDTVIAGLNTQIADSNTALTAEKTARADDAKLAAAKQRKSWIKGFKVGAIVGFVAGVFAGHSL